MPISAYILDEVMFHEFDFLDSDWQELEAGRAVHKCNLDSAMSEIVTGAAHTYQITHRFICEMVIGDVVNV